jgi:hypothetical protein
MEALRLKDKRYLMGGFGINVHVDASDHPLSLGRYINDPRDDTLTNARFLKLKKEKKALVIATRTIVVCQRALFAYSQFVGK